MSNESITKKLEAIKTRANDSDEGVWEEVEHGLGWVADNPETLDEVVNKDVPAMSEAIQAVLEVHVLDDYGKCMECRPEFTSTADGCTTRHALVLKLAGVTE